MSNRPGRLSPEQRIDIAVHVCAMREDRTPWKVIQRRLGFSTAQLRRYIRLMEQNRRLMSDGPNCTKVFLALRG